MHADHWHFETAKGWSASRDGVANALGGGHAHCGAMIYLGDNWPAQYRDHLFTLNYHGHRANQEILERSGSGYVGHHGADQFLFGDTWFRGLDLGYGPDGGVFVLDWSDTGECHESTGVHRTSGRIFKITWGEPRKIANFDLSKSSIPELLQMESHPNEWFVRQARQEFAARTNKVDAAGVLFSTFEKSAAPLAKLRALWGLRSAGALNESFLLAQLSSQNEYVRTWAIRLLTDNWPLDTIMSTRPAGRPANRRKLWLRRWTGWRNRTLRHGAPCPRIHVATITRSGAFATRQGPVVTRGGCFRPQPAANDLVRSNPLFSKFRLGWQSARWGRRFTAARRRIQHTSGAPIYRTGMAEDMQKQPDSINELLRLTRDKSDNIKGDVLAGMTDGLQGWSKAEMPPAWPEFEASLPTGTNQALSRRATELSVVFGNGRAIDDLKKLITDPKAELSARRSALETLINKRVPDLRDSAKEP